MNEISDYPAHVPDDCERVRNALTALTVEHRRVLAEFIKDPAKSMTLAVAEDALKGCKDCRHE